MNRVRLLLILLVAVPLSPSLSTREIRRRPMPGRCQLTAGLPMWRESPVPRAAMTDGHVLRINANDRALAQAHKTVRRALNAQQLGPASRANAWHTRTVQQSNAAERVNAWSNPNQGLSSSASFSTRLRTMSLSLMMPAIDRECTCARTSVLV